MASRSSSPSRATDAIDGVVALAAGVFLMAGSYLQVTPSVTSFGTLLIIVGAIGIAAALVGRTSSGFFSEIVSGSMAAVLGVLIVRTPSDAARIGFEVTAAFLLVNGAVRLASATEFVSLRGTFVIVGAASLALGAAVLVGALPASLASLGPVIGLALILDGIVAISVARRG